MYGRAGIGDSKFADPQTRTLDQLGWNELHMTPVTRTIGATRVLVPHSFGGFIARPMRKST